MAAYKQWFLIFICLGIIAAIGTLSGLSASMVWDEKCYVGAGKYILHTKNLKYNAFAYHPPLSYYLGSIFLYGLPFPESIYAQNDCWKIGYDTAYHSGYDPKIILLLSRFPFILLSLILATHIFLWARDAYGLRAGYYALFLYTFSTVILSQSNLAMTDFTVAVFFFLSLYYYWRYRTIGKLGYFFVCAIMVGLTLLSKLTGLLVVPIFIILISLHHLHKGIRMKSVMSIFREFTGIMLIGFIILWAGYGFQFSPLKDVLPEHYLFRAYEELNQTISPPALGGAIRYIFEQTPIPFPSYFFSIGAVGFHSKEGQGGFLDGKIFSKSPWYYPFAVFLYKTQLGLILLIILALILFRKTIFNITSDEFLILLPVFFIFALFSVNNMTAGLRHILPIYPFLFVFVSKLAATKYRLLTVSVWVILCYYIIAALGVYPHYLAYFNEIAGGPKQGYLHLVGSNLDFGQDLPTLKKYMVRHNISKVNLSYFGSIDPREYIAYDYMPAPYYQQWVPNSSWYTEPENFTEDCSERKGWVAISATNLWGVHLFNTTCFDWLKSKEPVKKVGYSIFVYNLN